MTKMKILVLDAFTNGSEAARAFIQRQGWTETDCEFVFCGTHSNIFKRLTEGPAYAVVPIRNSIAGEVTEVTKLLDGFRGMGYDLQEQDQLDLQINHCLLAPQHVSRAEELQRVMSHEKAMEQCGKYLNSIGITPDRRSKRDSTGNAAKAVAKLGPNVKIGAIAPKVAAEEYKLKILAERIQDVLDNKTRFVLLQNEATVRQVVVGIIGINGRFGTMLREFFEQLGCTVIGSDRDKPTDFTNEQIVVKSDVVLFSLSIKRTVEVIQSLAPLSREDQLWMDVTSVKQPAVKAMLQSKAQVVGLHPMFRPDVPFDGQTIVACLVHLTMQHWKTWVVNVLTATRARIKWSTPAEHDGYMTTVQVIPHLANLTSALLITEAGVSVSESLAFTSPFYRVMFSLMGRLVSQSPDLYTSIVIENPETVSMLERRIAIEQRLLEMIRRKDRDAFEVLFKQANEHFGPVVTKEANELFMRILGVLSTLYGKNSVILEFSKVQSRPGLLERISKVFSQHQINLTGINSVTLDGQRLQFTISFEQERESEEVCRALAEIEKCHDLRAKIIAG
ncbi:MAG: prephenate dehydrogenase/arogenate dehydrogenase family protein [bacterium]|nr:prephenate dehydrogenase/arogenate dehydrogenase family protein [bacterium]